MLVLCAKCLLLSCCQNVMWYLYLNTKQTLTTPWQLTFLSQGVTSYMSIHFSTSEFHVTRKMLSLNK